MPDPTPEAVAKAREILSDQCGFRMADILINDADKALARAIAARIAELDAMLTMSLDARENFMRTAKARTAFLDDALGKLERQVKAEQDVSAILDGELAELEALPNKELEKAQETIAHLKKQMDGRHWV